MPKERGQGEGGLYWSETRQRWEVEVTYGWTPAGKRRRKRASAKTKTEAKKKLKKLLDAIEAGTVAAEDQRFTVADAVADWLAFGLPNRDQDTLNKLRSLANNHVIPAIGKRKLTDLTAEEVDEWLAEKAQVLSTRTLRDVRSIPLRAINRAQAREKVRRNVVLLCECPAGLDGRPSKSLTLAQAEALLAAAEKENSAIGAYIVLSLLSGVRTEEARPLMWSHVFLPDEENDEEVIAHVRVWRSVRVKGDTKTKGSRRSLAMPKRCVDELRRQMARQATRRTRNPEWASNGLVFASRAGTVMEARNVRRAFRRVADNADLTGSEWTPRELRHSFVSLLSDRGVPIEQIARLVGHRSTQVTEQIYRHQLTPVVEAGATAMDEIFPSTMPDNDEEGDDAA